MTTSRPSARSTSDPSARSTSDPSARSTSDPSARSATRAQLGVPRLHLRQTDSTNVRARALAAAGAPHGTLVTAGEQLAGRGRQGRAWSSPPGGSLAASLVVRDPPALLSIAAGVAVAEVVDASLRPRAVDASPHPSAGGDALIKWPNDVLVAGRKLAGILVEARPQDHWAVLGIGINVAVAEHQLPAAVRDRAGSLNLSRAEIEPILALLLIALERWLPAPEPEILNAVRARDALLGEVIGWADGTGVAAGIDDHGRLLVQLASGEQLALDAGEVHLRRA